MKQEILAELNWRLEQKADLGDIVTGIEWYTQADPNGIKISGVLRTCNGSSHVINPIIIDRDKLCDVNLSVIIQKQEQINNNLERIVNKLSELDQKYLNNSMKEELSDIMKDIRTCIKL